MTMRPVIATLLLVLGPGCSCNLLPDPKTSAASAPETADVALGASHDLVVVGCSQKLTITDLVLGVGATALFVAVGRVDAVFYLPGAVISNPKCKDTQYAVSGAVLEGDAFELEPTQNDKVYKLHTRREGEATFRAQVQVGDDTHEVSSTFRAWKADRLEFAPRCQLPPAGVQVMHGWVPAGKSVSFTHQLFRGTTALRGYGFLGLNPQPRMMLSEDGTRATFTAERGPFTVTSDVDPAFMLQLTAYDATDYDGIALERFGNDAVFVGGIVSLRRRATIQGNAPCVDGFPTQLTVETPTVCRQREGQAYFQNSQYPIELDALMPGTCRVSLALPGSTLTPAVVQLEVYRGVEQVAELPTAAQHVTINLLDAWPASADDVHYVGWKDEISGRLESVTLRRTNGAWSALEVKNPPRMYLAVDGDPASGTALAVGARVGGAAWNGTTWTPFDAGLGEVRFEAVWVGGPSEAWAAGEDGLLARFDGAAWSRVDGGARFDLTGVWGDRDGGVYVVGQHYAKRWDGARFDDFLPEALTDAGYAVRTVEGTRPDDLWVTGTFGTYRWNGASWTRHVADGVVTKLRPVGDGHAYGLLTKNPGSSLPTYFLVRFGGNRTVYLPLPEAGRAISGWGDELQVLTKTKLLRYRHDPADLFP